MSDSILSNVANRLYNYTSDKIVEFNIKAKQTVIEKITTRKGKNLIARAV